MAESTLRTTYPVPGTIPQEFSPQALPRIAEQVHAQVTAARIQLEQHKRCMDSLETFLFQAEPVLAALRPFLTLQVQESDEAIGL